MIALSVSGIEKHFGALTVLSGVGFELQQGSCTGLVGPNGAGKSTLLSILAGTLESDGGNISVLGGLTMGYLRQRRDVLSESSVWSSVKAIYQPVFDMERQLRQLEHNMAQSQDDWQKYADEYAQLMEQYEQRGGYSWKSIMTGVLKGLGFSEQEFDQPVVELSGGQQLRLGLAELLISQPDILLLDEPSNYLDVESMQWLEDRLKKGSSTVLVVSHDRWFLQSVCDTILELTFGGIERYKGDYSYFIKEREQRYQKRIDDWQRDQRERDRELAIIRRYRAWGREKNMKSAKSREKRLAMREVVEKPKSSRNIHFQLDMGKLSGNDVLLADDLGMAFDKKELFSRLDLDIKRGSRLAIIGPNGCGKTTLLKVLSGRLRPTSGTFLLGAGVEIAYYDQMQEQLNDQNTVMNEVWWAYPSMEMQHVRDSLAAFLFRGDDVEKLVSSLSGGERSRLSMLKLMLGSHNLLLLDEPTSHLDLDSRQVMEEALMNYPGTIIFVSHDRYFVDMLSTHILKVQPSGTEVYEGGYKQYLSSNSEADGQETKTEMTRTQQDKQRRAERQIRAQEQSRTRQLAALEEDIEALELEIKQVEELLSKPDDADMDVLSLSQKHAQLSQKLESVYKQWESMH